MGTIKTEQEETIWNLTTHHHSAQEVPEIDNKAFEEMKCEVVKQEPEYESRRSVVIKADHDDSIDIQDHSPLSKMPPLEQESNEEKGQAQNILKYEQDEEECSALPFSYKHFTSVKMYECPQCNYKSKTRLTVIRHLKNTHGSKCKITKEIKLEEIKQESANEFCTSVAIKTADDSIDVQDHSLHSELVLQESPLEQNLHERKGQEASISLKHEHKIEDHTLRATQITPRHEPELQEEKDCSASPFSSEDLTPENTSATIYHCSQCSYKSKTRLTLIRHLKNAHGSKCKITKEMKLEKIKHESANEFCTSVAIKTADDSIDVQDHSLHSELVLQESPLEQNLQITSRNEPELQDDEECPVSQFSSEPENTMYHCSQCSYKSNTRNNFLRHWKKTHDVKRKITKHVKHKRDSEVFKCSRCDFTTKWKSYINQHVKNKHNDSTDSFKCTLCNYTTKTKKNLKKHVKNKHDDNVEVFKCIYCDYSSKWKCILKIHFKYKHDVSTESFKCTYCNQSFKRKCHRDVHVKKKHSDNVELFKCTYCDFSTKWKGNLNIHVKQIHEDSADVFKCSYCDFSFKHKSHLDRHVNVKHNDSAEMFKCNYCDFTTKWKCYLNQHVKKKHDDSNTDVFKCKSCDYSTKTKSLFNQHVKNKHDNDVPAFKCSYCDYSSKMQCLLKAHIKRTHDDSAKIFKCNYCDHSTKRKDHLDRHIKYKHDNSAEVFKCTYCDFTTKWRSYLNKHVKNQHSCRPEVFKCSHCNFSTKWKSCLNDHIKHKHNNTPQSLACFCCNRLFKTKRHLVSHFKSRREDGN